MTSHDHTTYPPRGGAAPKHLIFCVPGKPQGKGTQDPGQPRQPRADRCNDGQAGIGHGGEGMIANVGFRNSRSNATTRLQALGRLKTGAMNKTEAAYAKRLEERRILGEVAWYRFEGLKLRLADNTFYTPDFAVMLADGSLECHEVKGFWKDDARVKIKVAADQYPMKFIAVKARAKKHGGGWEMEEF